jgi:hypothetical protein
MSKIHQRMGRGKKRLVESFKYGPRQALDGRPTFDIPLVDARTDDMQLRQEGAVRNLRC